MRAGRPAGFTIDGPRGPRHQAKMGAVLLAKKTGAPVLPFTINAAHYYTVPSWDRFQVPLPFTRAHLRIAPPIYVPADADEALLNAKRDELQRARPALRLCGFACGFFPADPLGCGARSPTCSTIQPPSLATLARNFGGAMINQERIKNLLLELVQIDSVSRRERDVAERIKQHCEAMGAQVEIDDAGAKVGGNSGNVIARFPGTIPGAETIMMSAHMDTVVPGEGVKPIVEGDIIRSDGTTVLGGDDKSGCAVIIETIRCLQEQNIPHAPIEAVFSICEEVGLLGAKHVDVTTPAFSSPKALRPTTWSFASTGLSRTRASRRKRASPPSRSRRKPSAR
jgi:hypothetical protein